MKFKNIYLYIIIGLSMLLFSCSNDEGPLEPSDIQSASRFEFPEGDTYADEIFTDFYDKYEIQVLHRGWTEDDWFKSWTSPTPPISNQYYIGHHFENGLVDTLDIAAEFMRDYYFIPEIDSEIFRKTLPPYMYLVNSYAGVFVFPGIPPMATYVVTSVNPGMDFTLISPYSPTKETILKGDSDSEIIEKRKFGLVLLWATFFKNAFEGRTKTIVVPEGFLQRVNLDNKITTSDKTDKDYYLTRGLIDLVSAASFNSTTKPSTSTSESGYPGMYRKLGGDLNMFRDYVRLAMFYDEDEMEENYGAYPLVMYHYNWVVDYMMDEYGIDLKGIAKKH